MLLLDVLELFSEVYCEIYDPVDGSVYFQGYVLDAIYKFKNRRDKYSGEEYELADLMTIDEKTGILYIPVKPY